MITIILLAAAFIAGVLLGKLLVRSIKR